MTYQLLLTQVGQQKLSAAANTGGSPITISQFVLGQGVNVDFASRLDKQVLVSKRYQADVAGISTTDLSNQYEINCIVPQDVGGFTIREFGLIDSDGDLIWVGNLPEVVKPPAGSTTAVDYRIKAVVQIDNPDINLIIDANVVTATRAWVDDNFIPRSALELLYPYGYKYWSHSDESPKAGFDALFGYETFWRRLKGVHLVGVDEADPQIADITLYVGKSGDVTDNKNNPEQYLGYTSYLWERYDPNNIPVRYDGNSKYDGTASYQ